MNLVDTLYWINNAFKGALNWTPTANRTIALPDDSGTVLLDDRPIGTIGAGVSVRGYLPIVPVSSSKTLALSDSNTSQICTAASTITIPANATVAFPIGTEVLILRNTTGTINLALASGVVATDRRGGTNTLTTASNYILIKKTLTDTWIVIHPISSDTYLPGGPNCDTQALGTNNTTLANCTFVENTTVARVDKLSKVRYLFVLAGGDISGGGATNSTLTVDQLLSQNHAKIWNNTSSVFQPLQIGTNNLIAHTGLTDNVTHGIERGLAREILQTLQWPEAYVLKAGQGGSTIAQWSVGNATNYLSTLTSRYNSAVSALTSAGFTVRPIFIWFNGINDAIAGTNPTTWRTATQAHFAQIRSFMGANTPIFMPQIMPTNAAYTAINTEIATIDSADANMWALSTVNVPGDPSNANNYTANGYLQIARSFVDSFRLNLGVPGTFSIGQARTASSNPIVILKRSTALSIPHNSITPIPLNVVETDTDNMFNSANGTVVIPTGAEGLYTTTIGVMMDPSQQVRAILYVNGIVRMIKPVQVFASDSTYGDESTRTIRLNVGDSVSLNTYQTNTTSTAKNLFTSSTDQACLQMTRTGA